MPYADVDHYLSICERVIQEQGETNQTIMHCIFLGAAGVGKSCLMKRLLGEKVDITHRTSTQIAEKSVRVVSTAVAKVSDLTWKKIDDTSVGCGLMGQMLSEEVNQKEHKQENHLEKGDTNEVSNHTEGSKQVSVKKDEQLSAVKDANKQAPEQTVPVSKQNKSKQQVRVPNDSQPTNSTDDIQAAEEKVSNNSQVTNSTDDSQAAEEKVPNNSQVTNSTDDSQATNSTDSQVTEQRVPDDSKATNSTDDSEATEERAPYDTSSTVRGSSNSQQLQSIAFLRNVLETEGVSAIKKYINDPQTIYLTDSGGQPEFQELLPALVVGPCIFIVVLPLNKDLKEKYEVEYVRPEKHMKTYSSSLSMEEDLLCSLASIASTKYEDETGKKVKKLVMFVATFIDKVPLMERQKKLDNIEALFK